MLYVIYDTKNQNYVYACYQHIGRYKRKQANELATYYNSLCLNETDKTRFVVKSEYELIFDGFSENSEQTQRDYKALTLENLYNNSLVHQSIQ